MKKQAIGPHTILILSVKQIDFLFYYHCFMLMNFYTEAALSFANTSEKTTKKQLHKLKEKKEINIELVKLCYLWLRTCNLEYWRVTPCPLGHERLTTGKH